MSQSPLFSKHLPSAARMRFLAVSVLILAILVAGCGRVQTADDEYEQTLEQIDSIQEYLGEREIYELNPEDMAWLEREFATLAQRVERMEDASSLPLGLDRVAEFGSARYRSMMEMLEVAALLAESGQIIANIANESMTALDEHGFRFDSQDDGETWLEVIHRRDSEIDEALLIMDEALTRRAMIDESELPGRVQGNLYRIDQMIEDFGSQIELAQQREMAYEALGIDEQRRYLVLFQNPTELRPTGGFVGTITVLELHRGQISSYEFQDVYDISRTYSRVTSHEIEPPWAISEYVRPDKLQFQDANWWPNFPDSASMLIEMADASDWPELHGVAAVQPETFQDLIDVAGAIEVEVDGETRTITSDNLLEESERQRRVQRETGEGETGHKEVIELIGEVLIDQLSLGDRDDLIPAVLMMFDRLDQRDMQAYHEDENVQQFLEERNWAGLIEPQPDTPTLSTIFANVTGLKTSLAMQPTMDLYFEPDDEDDSVNVTATISLEHTGAAGGDPFYEGFQRYWIDVNLPENATLLDSSVEAAEDPDASSGGAYVVNLHVETTEEITIEFSMPITERLLLRRQPGLVTMYGGIEQSGCDEVVEYWGDRDIVLLLDGSCPEIEWIEE